MGSLPIFSCIGGVGSQVYAPLPCFRTLPSQSFTVAVLAIARGAALSASRIIACLSPGPAFCDIGLEPALFDALLGGASCAAAAVPRTAAANNITKGKARFMAFSFLAPRLYRTITEAKPAPRCARRRGNVVCIDHGAFLHNS